MDKFLKKLPLEKQKIFWEAVFGFTTYDRAIESFTCDSSEQEAAFDEQLDEVIIFLKLLEDYRILIESQKNSTFQQVDKNHLRVFTQNNLEQLWPFLNLSLNAKLFSQNGPNILETNLQEENEFQKIQLRLLSDLIEVDYIFFIYVQMCYSLLNGSIFSFFKKYINYSAYSMFSGMGSFDWFYPLDFPTTGKIYSDFQKRREKQDSQDIKLYEFFDRSYIEQSWEKQIEVLNLIDFNEEIGSHIMQLWLRDFKIQVKCSIAIQAHLKSQYIQDIKHTPMTHFFWNNSKKNDREFSLILQDKSSYDSFRVKQLINKELRRLSRN